MYPRAGEVVLSTLDGRRQSHGKRGQGRDPGRCKAEAERRAKRELRRFAKDFRLFFMWTLTYGDGGQRDLVQLRRQVERLIAKVAEEHGRRFPYVYVVEFHKDGERLHVHVAVPFFFDQRKLTVLWAHGHVWCSDKRKRGECAHVGATRAASYLSKYLGKAFEVAEFGRHRYERARGFTTSSYQVRVRDLDAGQAWAEALFMCRPEFVWESSSFADWKGPPIRVLFFTPGADDG